MSLPLIDTHHVIKYTNFTVLWVPLYFLLFSKSSKIRRTGRIKTTLVFSPLERECEVVPLTAAGTEAVTVDVVDEGTLNKKNKDAISRTFYFVVVYNTKSESCFYFLS